MNTIAFDVDGTLITFNDEPNYPVINLLIALSKVAHIVVWSGGGKEYAERWVERLGLKKYVLRVSDKDDSMPDVCFDDEFVMLAKVNIKVPHNLLQK